MTKIHFGVNMLGKLSKLLLATVFGLALFGSASAFSFDLSATGNFTEDSSLQLDLAAATNSTGATGALTYTSAGSAHIHVAISGSTATLTADANWNGQESITFRVNDSATPQNTLTDSIQITVTAVNDAPAITLPAATLEMAEGIAFTYAVNVTDVDAGDTKTFTATPTQPWTSFQIGANTGVISFTPSAADIGTRLVDIRVTDKDGLYAENTFRFFVKDACDTGAILFSSITVDDVTGDDSELQPGDYLEAEFDVKNRLAGGKDLSDVKVSAWIEDLKNNERYSAKIVSAKKDIENGESETLLLRLRLDMDAKRTNDIKSTYALYLKAEGEDEDGTALCGNYYKDLKASQDTDRLLIDNTNFNTESATCGDSVTATASLWNIGRSSQDDVRFKARNSALKIDTATSIFELLTSGSKQKAAKELAFTVPADAKAGDYPIEFIASYGDESATETKTLHVSCESPTAIAEAATAGSSNVAVSQSAITVNREQTVKYTVTLTNTESGAADYTFSLAGIADWAKGTVEPDAIRLGAGKSMPVYVYLTPKFDASGGEHTATLTIKSGATVIDSKTLTANVNAPTTTVTEFGNSALSGAASLNLGGLGQNRDSVLFVAIVLIVVIGAAMYFRRNGDKRATRVVSNF